ncbi:MAG: hypothetical protein J2P44_04980 [Candidatus Dormibacteraeota bacterium]|nr:hypothetical protein [Candidatus Dormibacteraeota bacterium]
MARTWVTPAGGTEGHSWDVNREGGHEDPRGVLLSVEQLVLAAGESVRRLRHVEWVSRSLDGGWADDKALGEMADQLEEVRGRLTRLRDQARQGTAGDAGRLRPDRTH